MEDHKTYLKLNDIESYPLSFHLSNYVWNRSINYLTIQPFNHLTIEPLNH